MAGTLLASAVPEALFPGARLLIFCVVFLGIGPSGNLVQSTLDRRAKRVVRCTRPADGRVDVAAVEGVRKEPNFHDTRFGRFVSLESGSTPVAERERRFDPRPRPPVLLGRVVLCSIYVGMDGRSWSDSELTKSHEALIRAGAWVENEAIRWGAAVNIEVADTDFVADVDGPDEVVIDFVASGKTFGPLEGEAEVNAMVTATRAAVRLGFRDASDLTKAIEGRFQADATVWLLHLRRAGTSLAMIDCETSLQGVNLAVCYCREASFPEPLDGLARTDPVTVVHEMLHLFGAADKYNYPLKEFERGSVSSREVMRLSEVRLSRLRVDRLTAREIGWVGSGTG